MNDAQWLRHWCAQNVKAAAGDLEANAKELARAAEAAAARDGFSVDGALRAEGHASLSGYMRSMLRARQGETSRT